MTRKLIFSATKADFKIDTFTTGGPGGQHQNRSQTGVRITHIPSGLSSECREHRSQHRNRKEAFRKLAELLVQHYVDTPEHEISEEVIRTYNEPDNRVKDHASGLQMRYKDVVEKADIGPMIEARKRALNEQD